MVMSESYENIPAEVARKVRLVMTDVDGTITSEVKGVSSRFPPEVVTSLRLLEASGITVGLVSGRNMPDLDEYAANFGISGPLIGENGAMARMRRGGVLVDLGVSQKPALEALEKLKKLFPEAIETGDWNKSRAMDLIIKVNGVAPQEIARHLDGCDLLDSGYIFHLVQKGINKGTTLKRLLTEFGEGGLSSDTVMVFGDAPTDQVLFETFPYGVLIVNPELPMEKRQALYDAARYVSSACCGAGFAEVTRHVLAARGNGSGAA